ncbi:hypothetical protein [Brevibacillus daliensis]|uniref:hypothetical protein n=1 Tax=Brevibacillus daliensis TaxID=2892995 RepID=UPI001E3C081D|nr:hypothetical protein [Brevibacillus daliensis]
MNKILSILILLVITLPLTASVLFIGPDSMMTVSINFFSRLLEIATSFGVK